MFQTLTNNEVVTKYAQKFNDQNSNSGFGVHRIDGGHIHPYGQHYV